MQKPAEIPKDIGEKLLGADWNNDKGNQQEEYQKFQTYLAENKDQSEQIFAILRTIESEDLSDFIFENGFIINPDTQKVFEAQFGKSDTAKSTERDTTAEARKSKAESELIETEQENQNEEKIRQQFQQHIEMFK